jgi:hypothetical protein
MKVTKANGTLCRAPAGFLALLVGPGGNQTRPSRAGCAYPAAELEQVIADFPRPDCAAQRGSKGFCPRVTVSDFNPAKSKTER